MEISKKTLDELKKAGWYEGRKIEIKENVKFLEEKGFEVFESARKFMEEFGEMEINVEKIWEDGSEEVSEHTTCIRKVIGMGDSSWFGLENFIDHDDRFIEEKVMPIAELYDHGTTLYISESGKMYKQTGWIGDTVWEAWDNIILEKGGRIWKEIRYPEFSPQASEK